MGTTEYDPNFEFNAPKYHDFTNPTEDDGADAWFDNLNSSAQEERAGAEPVSGATEQESRAPVGEISEGAAGASAGAGEADEEPDSNAADPADSAMNISVDPAMNISVDPAGMVDANDEEQAEDGDVLAAYTGATSAHMEEETASEHCVDSPVKDAEVEVPPAAEHEGAQNTAVAHSPKTAHEESMAPSADAEECGGDKHDPLPAPSAEEAVAAVESTPSAEPAEGGAMTSGEPAPIDAPTASPALPETLVAPAPAPTEAASLADAALAAKDPPAAAPGPVKQSSRVYNKLTESILSLAEFKSKERELKSLAQSSVASLASREVSREPSREPSAEPCSAPLDTTVGADDFAARCSMRDGDGDGDQAVATEDEEPVAARTRRSLEARGAAEGGWLEGIDDKAEEKENSGQGSGSKRGHRAGQAGTPQKPQSKKTRTEGGALSTPSFSRFGSRGGAGGGPGSAMKTPGSAARARPTTPASASLCRATSASAARAAAAAREAPGSASRLRGGLSASSVGGGGGAPRLTVPVSPQLSAASRGVRRQRSASELSSGGGGGGGGVGRQRSASRVGSEGSVGSLRGAEKTPRRPTVPVSPRLSSAARSVRRRAVGTEEAKMREAEAAVEQLRKRRRVGEARLKQVLAEKPAGGERERAGGAPAKALTTPAGPTLRAARRVRSNSVSALEGGRSSEALSSARAAGEGEGGKTLGERLAAFHQGRGVAGGAGHVAPTPRREGPRGLTEPKTPDFASFRRAGLRGAAKSRAEQEEEELARMKAAQFKARPLNRRVLESAGDLGVPKVARKALTTPQGPVSHTSSRASLRSSQSSLDSLAGLSREGSLSSQGSLSSLSRVRATPSRQRPASAVPSSESKPRKLTVPVSPRLASSMRVRASAAAAASEGSDAGGRFAAFKAQPAPDMSRRFEGRQEARKATEPAPFQLSTDQRHAARQAEAAAARLQREQQHGEKKGSKGGRVGGVTDPQPFKLQSSMRHEIHQAQLEEAKRRLEEENRAFASFHARPVPKAVTDSDKAFTPRRSSKPLTEVQGFELNVDRRGRERQHYEVTLKEREAKAEEAKAAEERRRHLEAERERRELRKQAAVKARPVPASVYHAQAEAPKSSKPLTEPHSPHFRMDTRLRGAH